MTRQDTQRQYAEIITHAEELGQAQQAKRALCLSDLYFLLVHGLGRADADRDWLFARCREVEAAPDGYLDLWAREHYKSTIITYGLTIQDILRDPEITVAILSYNRPTAKAFLRQIKREFEDNQTLKALFPDVLWANPQREAPMWSEDGGIVVKRRGNPKEATVEAWGVVDGQPTGRHYKLMVYDDVVTLDSVTSPLMIDKVTQAWELSRNLTSEDGGRTRYIGTRYHYADTYASMMERGAAIPRIHPAVGDDGKPVLLTQDRLDEKRRDMGPYIFSCQLMQQPVVPGEHTFRPEWLLYWDALHYQGLNLYIFVDPANSKRKQSDYTVMAVVALAADSNYYVVHWVRDRLNLVERANLLFRLHQQYRPVAVFYEEYGIQADRQHMQDRMNRENYRFALRAVGGQVAKNDRIERLIPLFEAGRVYLPTTCVVPDCEGKQIDMTKAFVSEEYNAYPYMAHDDMLDCLARIADPAIHLMFPQPVVVEQRQHLLIPGSRLADQAQEYSFLEDRR